MLNKQIIIFDGVCNFCNGAVNFIIRRDPTMKFQFVPMQSEHGQELMKKYDVDCVTGNTLLLIKDDVCYVRSDAALEIAGQLEGSCRMLAWLSIIPRPLRDLFYQLVARNRYMLFGKREVCMVPSDDMRERFVLTTEENEENQEKTD